MLTAIHTPRPPGEAEYEPDALRVLKDVSDRLEARIRKARQGRDTASALRHTRDRALVLMLFWRPVGVAELLALRIGDMRIAVPAGVSCRIVSDTGFRQLSWRPVSAPDLRRLCPVAALRSWLTVAGLHCGPLFPRITHSGNLAHDGLPAEHVLTLLLDLTAVPDDAATGQSEDATGAGSREAGKVPSRSMNSKPTELRSLAR